MRADVEKVRRDRTEATEAGGGLARAEVGADEDTIRAMTLPARSTRDAIRSEVGERLGDAIYICVCTVSLAGQLGWNGGVEQPMAHSRRESGLSSVGSRACLMRWCSEVCRWKGRIKGTTPRHSAACSHQSMRMALCQWLPPAYRYLGSSTTSRSGSRITRNTRCGVDKLTTSPITSPCCGAQ